MTAVDEQLRLIPGCVVDEAEESNPGFGSGFEYSAENAVVNPTDNPDEYQVIISCPVEGCTAEIEAFSDIGLETFSAPTPATLQGAYLVCKNRRKG